MHSPQPPSIRTGSSWIEHRSQLVVHTCPARAQPQVDDELAEAGSSPSRCSSWLDRDYRTRRYHTHTHAAIALTLAAHAANALTLAARPRRCAIALKGPPPIASRYFESLLTPAQFEELLEKAPSDAISIIKFQATYCRTCRATAPLLDRVAKKYPTAKFYDLTLARDGKAAGERMYRFFKSRGIKEMPYIEVYAGSERVEAEVVVPSGIERLQQMIAAAQERLTAGVWRGQRARLLQLQREFRNARRPKKERDAAERRGAERTEEERA